MSEISNKETNEAKETDETKETSESTENKELSTKDKLNSLDDEKREKLNKEFEDYKKNNPDATREEAKEYFSKRIDEEYNSEDNESNEDETENNDEDDDDVENDNELSRDEVKARAKTVDESGNLSREDRQNMREELKGAKDLEAKNEIVKKYEGIAEENEKKNKEKEEREL